MGSDTMKIPKLVLSVAMALVFGGAIRADTVDGVTIPTGVTITSETSFPDSGSAGVDTSLVIDYVFAGGSGTSTAYANGDGNFGSITFSEPVSSLSFAWVTGSFFEATVTDQDETVGSTTGYSPLSAFCIPVCPATTSPTFTGPIDGVIWDAGYSGTGGIVLMDFTSQQLESDIVGVPEPPLFAFLGLGLLGLVALRPNTTLK